MRLNEKLTRWAAAAALSIVTAAPCALAGSVTQPGDTMGSAAGAPIPPGFYFANQMNWGCADTTQRTCVFTEIPLFAWSTPWEILGGKLAFATAPTTLVDLDIDDTHNATGLFNPFIGSTLTWDLGHGWGFTYLLGAYLDVDTSVAYSSTSLNQRFGLGYHDNGWNLIRERNLGHQFRPGDDRPTRISVPDCAGFGMQPELHQP